jgi:uncharacterized protein (UPF0303 family)
MTIQIRRLETAATEGTKAAYTAWVSRRLKISRRLKYSRRLQISRRCAG